MTISAVPGVTIRAAGPPDAAAMAAVHVASWRETYAGLFPQSVLDHVCVSSRTRQWEGYLTAPADPVGPAIFVAEADGAIVGFLSCAPQRDEALRNDGFTGEITALYVMQSVQRRGVGRGLMATGAQALHARGHRAASLWVVRDNGPALAFYQHLGGAFIRERALQIGDATLPEWALGWRDLARMAQRPPAAPA